MKGKLKEKYLLISQKDHLLDQLHNLHQYGKSIQDYMTKFDDLTFRYEVKVDSH